MKPLLYLATRRLINSLKRVPKNPRLLLPVLFLLLAFAGPMTSFFFAHRDGGVPPADNPFTPRELTEGGPGVFVAAIRGLLLFSVLGSITAVLGEGSLFFSPSDIDFLFPAPLRRRAVLLFKMLGTYLGLFFPALYFPVLLGGRVVAQSGQTPLALWPGMLGAWLFLVATTSLTQLLLLARAPEEDDARRERRERARKTLRWLVTGVLIAGAVALYLVMSQDGLHAIRTPLRAINSGPASLLLPIAWASDLFLVAFTGWGAVAAAKLAGLMVFAGLSLVALFGRDHDFYEGAMEFSARRGQAMTAARRGDATAMIEQMVQEGKVSKGRGLRPFGGGVRSLVWKDAVIMTRTPARSWLTLLFIAAVPALIGRGLGGGRGGPGGVVFWMIFFMINLSNVFLLSIRTMLKRADITKALPIPPARFLLAETVFSIVLLTGLGWISLGLMTLLGAQRGPVALVAFLCLPSLAALILVTGPTGSGKSTTIAAMIDVINSERPVHILTMEDPIEYLHLHKKGMINQRELGSDTDSFHNALRAVLREDPDVILVGEMRDKETIAAALTLAETGHLVFGTLHTRNAPQTVDRVVDVFPPDQQDQIKVQLSNSLEAVVAQQLVPMLGGGRVAAIEVMIATSAIRNLIREGKTYQILSAIETGTQYGMQPMDKVLVALHKSGQISHDEAILRAIDRENFLRLLKGF